MITLRERYATIEVLTPIVEAYDGAVVDVAGSVHRAYEMYLFFINKHIDISCDFYFDGLAADELMMFSDFIEKFKLPLNRNYALNPKTNEWYESILNLALHFDSTTCILMTIDEIANENKLSYSYVAMMLGLGYSPEAIRDGKRPSHTKDKRPHGKSRKYFRVNNSRMLTLREICNDYGLNYNQVYYRLQEATSRGLSHDFVIREFLRPILGESVVVQNVFN